MHYITKFFSVVAPLLVLMLADGESLILQVVPRALLEFSRSILRERFSCIIRKPIYTFDFDRYKGVSSQLHRKLIKAKENFGVVISHPTAVKALFLKFIEILHIIEKEDNGSIESYHLREQIDLCEQIFKIFRTGVLILDEVDLVLHPLKSELNFPIGQRSQIDFVKKTQKLGSGLRYEIAFILIDAILYSYNGQMASPSFDLYLSSQSAIAILQSIKSCIEKGLSRGFLQRTPHVVLLSRSYYHNELKPLIARWIVLWLSSKPHVGISDDIIYNYLLLSKKDRELMRTDAKEFKLLSNHLEKLDDDFTKLINLAYDWIQSFLPFILEKINRVSFGLLNSDDIKRLLKEDPLMPKSRLLSGVPFVGKDVPSPCSEFSHPDVVIGLSILAYRYEGLRKSDFKSLFTVLLEDFFQDSGPFELRISNQEFEHWIFLAGGIVKGSKRFREKYNPSRKKVACESYDDSSDTITSDESFEVQIWPLRLIDINDQDQFDALFKLLRNIPRVIHYYLSKIVFPAILKHQNVKLSASGQELGGTMLFNRRIGFSGTPSELIPLELNKCMYEKGSDAKIICNLSSTSVMSFEFLKLDWNVRNVLDRVAQASPPYHALIDTGALVTGLSNYEVAKYLLLTGLPDFEGVVFLDKSDKKKILLRSGFRVVNISQTGIPIEKRFTFFDQIHTTGMDIPQPLVSRAFLTLGKDMVFRDFAQGAFRMRRIGNGQTVTVIIPPEVKRLIDSHCSIANLKSESDYSFLNNICAWLLINGIKSERTQFDMLCEQNCLNLWRKRAFYQILNDHKSIGNPSAPDATVAALDLLRERIDHSVLNSVPKDISFPVKLATLIRQNSKFLSVEDKVVVSSIEEVVYLSHKNVVYKGESKGDSDDAEDGDAAHAFNAEQQQEKEQEQEQEQEQEKVKQVQFVFFLAFFRSKNKSRNKKFRMRKKLP